MGFTLNASYFYAFDYYIYTKDEMFLPNYNGLFGIKGRKVILREDQKRLGYYQYFRLSRYILPYQKRCLKCLMKHFFGRIKWKTLDLKEDGLRCDPENSSNTTQCISTYVQNQLGCRIPTWEMDEKLSCTDHAYKVQ